MSRPIAPPTLYWDGQAQTASSGHVFDSTDPSTAKPIAQVPSASEADVDSAVASAKAAFPRWASTPAVARARVLLKAVQLIRERNDELARMETLDTGKPFSETSVVDVPSGADVVEYFANMVASGGLNGESIQLRETAWVYTKKEPLGVCAGIGAWNYPLQMYGVVSGICG